ncbi:hypothetical protein EON64_18925 [archaeon]|nr:MAG: hypothetical protein EON64_18925 [archaeon]
MEDEEHCTDSEAREAEQEESLFVSIYDRASYHTTLRIGRKITAKDIVQAIAAKIDLPRSEVPFHSLVVVVAVQDPARKCLVHVVRTIQNNESVLNTLDAFLSKVPYPSSFLI